MSSTLPSDTGTPTIHAKPYLSVVPSELDEENAPSEEQETRMVTTEAPSASSTGADNPHAVILDATVFTQLKEISAKESAPVADILANAFQTERWLKRILKEGARVTIRYPDGSRERLSLGE